MELPEHSVIGTKHYLIWSSFSFFGFIWMPLDAFTSGTYYAMVDAYDALSQ